MLVAGATGGVGQLATAKLLEVRRPRWGQHALCTDDIRIAMHVDTADIAMHSSNTYMPAGCINMQLQNMWGS